MNILEIEDMIKGLPDQALQREAQMPSGQIPQFLVVSEIQRRGDMRKRFSERQPQGTVKDQVIQEGIAAMAPPEPQMQAAMMGMQRPMSQAMQQPMPQDMQQPMPMDQPPMGMFEGGVVQMANGMQVPGLHNQLMPTAPEQLTDRQASMQQMIERIQKRQVDAPIIPDFLTQDTKPMLQARERYSDSPVQQMITQANQPQQTPFSPENYEQMIASLEGTGLDSALASPLPTQTIDIVKLAEQSLRQQGLPGPQAQDGSRLDQDDAVQETQELAGAADSTASLSGTPEQVVPGANTAGPKDTPTPDAGGGAKQGTGASAEGQRLRSVTETLTDDFLESMVGDESIVGQIKAKSSSLAKAIRNRERPTLDYSTLIAEYEAQMQPEIDALKKERGSQALIALGAGIAKGDLSAGLSGAAKAAAASNAERRALKAKQQAAQMGLKKSQVDAAYQNDLEQSADEIKAIAAEVEALKGYGIAVRQAESMAFSKAAEAEKVIAKMAADRDLQAARLAQDSEREQGLLRRAAIDAAKEFIRSLDDVTVARLGEKGIRDEFNRAIVEYAGALGANLQSDLTASRQSEGSTGDMSIGGYRVREST